MTKRSRWILALGMLSALVGVIVGLSFLLPKRAGDGPTICVAQYVSHPALDAVRIAYEKMLRNVRPDATIRVQNAEGDATTARAIADQFCTADCKLVFALATPMAQAVHSRCQTNPWLFGAITDPVSAGLVKDMASPGGLATGSSDQWPYQLQMELIAAMWGAGTKVGAPHNPGEANSEFAMRQTRSAASAVGLELVEVPIHSTSQVAAAVESLRGRAIVIYVPADNTAMAAAPAIVATAKRIGLPVVAGDPGTFEAGAIFGIGVSYSNLGVLNAEQTLAILSGADPRQMPVAVSNKPELYVSDERAASAALDPEKVRRWHQSIGSKK